MPRHLEHGQRSTYGRGCRCPSCTYANAAYQRTYSAEQRRLARIGKAVEKITNTKEKSK